MDIEKIAEAMLAGSEVSKVSNPFFHNYVFHVNDLHRARIRWWEYPFLWFKPMLAQVSDGYVWKFKYGSNGAIYFFGAEKLPARRRHHDRR